MTVAFSAGDAAYWGLAIFLVLLGGGSLLGHPLDRLGPISEVRNEPLVRRPINAMDRDPVRQPLDTGVRAINTMLTVGRGQRIGLFAGSGVGKSVLLGMMAKYTAADVIVVGLIGERGREVKEFIEDILGTEGLRRSVVVAAPADAPPLTRMQGASYATAIAWMIYRYRGVKIPDANDPATLARCWQKAFLNRSGSDKETAEFVCCYVELLAKDAATGLAA